MKSNSALCTLALLFTTGLAHLSIAQDDEGLQLDDLFEEDFEMEEAPSIHDPFEKVNRAIFDFNDEVYATFGRPFANAYARVMPDPVERSITNVFTNLKFPSRFVGNVLQGRFGEASKETGQFVVNTTVGIGGIFRVSDKIPSLQTNKEDFGQALGSWGVKHGFYIVLPILGPSSLRDFASDFVDDAIEPIPSPNTVIDDSTDRMVIRTVEVVNQFPSLMNLYDSMKRSAIDPYASVRDAYAQRRAIQISE
ncbi:MlaA family lipoprotein [Pelagicoccus albus]|uniref:VacJ family lipoprotein n=1 Tax=Pelagicoccus albus TaxID=415222 RepID=A0A7X1B525_9BACT|nr:VacJ family lipoprotein [Pelagicoccus albus]MBC2605544.1 VacJ family lipoprotein [Pelagicoccus albus]